METGKRDPGIRTLVRIAAALNTTAAELLAGVKNR
jgi:transcriptional regulator with XRE-family HTH domain